MQCAATRADVPRASGINAISEALGPPMPRSSPLPTPRGAGGCRLLTRQVRAVADNALDARWQRAPRPPAPAPRTPQAWGATAGGPLAGCASGAGFGGQARRTLAVPQAPASARQVQGRGQARAPRGRGKPSTRRSGQGTRVDRACAAAFEGTRRSNTSRRTSNVEPRTSNLDVRRCRNAGTTGRATPIRRRMKLAVVVQRYGADINGGAELHARYIAEHLSRHAEVEVVTTCARDYVTWRNELPAGVEQVNGVTVRRFPVAHERKPHDFGRRSRAGIRAAALDGR